MPLVTLIGNETILSRVLDPGQNALITISPQATRLADGRVVLVWHDYHDPNGDPDGAGVQAQVFNPDGTPAGPAILVNSNQNGDQERPEVTALQNGGFVVTWRDRPPEFYTSTGAMRVFDPAGQPVGDVIEFPGIVLDAPRVVPRSDGGFTVFTPVEAYDAVGDGFGYLVRVYASSFTATGTALGEPSLVLETEWPDAGNLRVTALEGDRAVALWSDRDDAGTTTALRYQLFDIAGGAVVPIGDERALYGTIQPVTGVGTPDVTPLSGGRFLLSWTTIYAHVEARLMAADGTPLTAVFEISEPGGASEDTVSFAELTDGRVVAAFADVENGDILIRVFRPGSAVMGDVFRLEGAEGQDTYRDAPEVTALANGRFIVTYMGNDGTGSDYSIRSQVFAAGLHLTDTAGANRLTGSIDNDRLAGLGGADALSGLVGSDTLLGDAGRDTLRGGTGDDLLRGGTQGDRIFGQAGVDRLFGQAGADTLLGGMDNDRVNGGAGADRMQGGHGNDRVNGQAGNDQIQGNTGADRLAGGAGRDRMQGGAGNDQLSGGAGADRLDGGTGRDRLTGGAGADDFIFGRGYGIDRVTDFSLRQGDQLHLDDRLWQGRMSAAEVVEEFAVVTGAGIVLRFGADLRLTLSGFTSPDALADAIVIF